MISSQIPSLLVAIPLVAGLSTPILYPRAPRLTRAIAAAALVVVLGLASTALATAVVFGPIHYRFGGWAPPWGIEYVIDPAGGLMAVLVALFAALSFAGLAHEARDWGPSRAGAFLALFLLLVTGLLGISVTGDFFNLYVFLEISAISSYALIAAGGSRAKVAAFRYLILGSVAATFWVIGLGYFYAMTGTLNIADMSARMASLSGSRAVTAGLAFITAGLAVKMAVFPLHGWQPDAYSYAPASAIPFIAAVGSKVAAYVLLRVLYTLFLAEGAAGTVLEVLGWVAAASIIAGSLAAVVQSDIRRMLAYSSVSQIGYVVLGFAIGTPLALTGAVLHIVNHALMKGCLFFGVAGIRARTGKTGIDDLAGLGTRMPWTAAAVTAAALSMVGLPPFCGFFSKLYLVTGALQTGSWSFVAALAASSLLGAVYFFRVVERLYMARPDPGVELPVHDSPARFLAPAVFLAVLILGLGLGNRILVDTVIEKALPFLGGIR